MDKLNTLALEGKINENASIKDQHSIIINCEIDKVWKILSDIEKWPEWNSNIRNVKLTGKVERDGSFQWRLDGTRISSQIQAVEPPSMLSWTGKSKWVKSIFVWQLDADDQQTIATLAASFQGGILVNTHQKIYNELIKWLDNLKNIAEG